MGGGGHHKPIHRLLLGRGPGLLPSSFPAFLPPNPLLAAAAAAPLAAGEGPRGQLRARLVLGWRREKEGRRKLLSRPGPLRAGLSAAKALEDAAAQLALCRCGTRSPEGN